MSRFSWSEHTELCGNVTGSGNGGHVVDVSDRGIAVNGSLLRNSAPLRVDTKGRPLPAWRSGHYVVATGMVWVASSYNPRSFDSRYFGPVPVSSIRDYVRPLATGW